MAARTTHEERMMFLDRYSMGWPTTLIAKETGHDAQSIAWAINRMLELTWECEGRDGPPLKIRGLKKAGLFSDLILSAKRHEAMLKDLYGRKGVKLRAQSSVDRVTVKTPHRRRPRKKTIRQRLRMWVKDLVA